MHPYRPTLRQLSFLKALAEHRNFSRAAESQFVTQSTLSAGIMELETLLGAALVERTKRMVRITPLGAKVVARAEAILTQTDDLVDLVKGAAEPLAGEVRLGAIPTIGPFLLPRAIAKLRRDHPALKLFLHEGQTKTVLGMLAGGELDVVLIAFPYPVKNAEVEILSDDPFSLICPEGHPFAGRTAITTKELIGEDLLLLEEGHCLRDHALSVCNLPGLTRPDEFRATSLETLVLMVEGGLGLTLVPKIAIDAGLLKGKKVHQLILKGAESGRQIGLAWRKTSARGVEFRLLGDYFRTPLGL